MPTHAQLPRVRRGRRALATSLVSACLLAALAPGEAAASGFATARFGAEHGHPTTNNPTAIYYNPAGIADSEGFHVFVDGSLAWRSATYVRPASSFDVPEPAGAEGANTGEATLLNPAVAPMLGATAKLGNLALGAAVFVPFGGGASWNKNEAFADQRAFPGPVDGVQRWWSIEGNIRSLYGSLAGAYRIPLVPAGPALSIGVALNVISSTVQTLRARTVSGTNDVADEGRSYIDASGTQLGFGVGALLEAVPKVVYLGASYQSRPNVSGGMKLSGTLQTNLGGSVSTESIDLYQDLPDILRFGVRAKLLPMLELRAFGDYTFWSAFVDQCVVQGGSSQGDVPCSAVRPDGTQEGNGVIQYLPRDWNDAFGVRLGASLFVTPAVEVMLGVGYDSNAIPDETLDPALTDFHDVSAALGGRFKLGERVGVAATYTQFFYAERDTTGRYALAVLRPPSAGPDAGGVYDQSVGVLNLNVDVGF